MAPPLPQTGQCLHPCRTAALARVSPYPQPFVPTATHMPWMACTACSVKVRTPKTPKETGGRAEAGAATLTLPPTEGLKKLFSGATMASSRGMLVTVGQVGSGAPLGVGVGSRLQDPDPTLPCPQLSCYDQAKQLVLSTGYLSDNILTHFIASFIAVSTVLFLRVHPWYYRGPGPDLCLLHSPPAEGLG